MTDDVMTPEERAAAVLETFYFGPGQRASPGMVDDVAAAIREAVAVENKRLRKVLVLAALPLEAIAMIHHDGVFLAPDTVAAVMEARDAIRAEFTPEEPRP
jgi:hypothetical protein